MMLFFQKYLHFPFLPDEGDPLWDKETTWEELMNPYFGLAEVAAERRLEEAISLLLDKASYGDP